MQAPAGILLERRGRVGRVTLDRPPLNVLDIAAFDALHAALAELAARDPVDVILLQAAGPSAPEPTSPTTLRRGPRACSRASTAWRGCSGPSTRCRWGWRGALRSAEASSS